MSLNPSYPGAISPLVERINEVMQNSSLTNGSLHFGSDIERRSLITAAEKLLIAARSPEENVFAIAQQVKHKCSSLRYSC